MKKLFILNLLALLSLSTTLVFAEGVPVSKSPEGAKVYIVTPSDGETVATEVLVVFGLQGMGVAPAGTDKENTGHHHLIIDGKELPDLDKPMGADVVHFGGGQTEMLIKLEKGKHTLQMILGNYLHVPHNPPVVSEKITINVE